MIFDILKQKVKVNDKVIYIPPYSNDIEIGIVIKLTPKMAEIKSIKTGDSCKRRIEKIVKINEQFKNAQEKYPENYIWLIN